MAPGTGIHRARDGSKKPLKMISSHTGAQIPTITRYIALVPCGSHRGRAPGNSMLPPLLTSRDDTHLLSLQLLHPRCLPASPPPPPPPPPRHRHSEHPLAHFDKFEQHSPPLHPRNARHGARFTLRQSPVRHAAGAFPWTGGAAET